MQQKTFAGIHISDGRERRMDEEEKAVIRGIIFDSLPCATNKSCKEIEGMKTEIKSVKDKQNTQTGILIGLLVAVISTLLTVIFK